MSASAWKIFKAESAHGFANCNPLEIYIAFQTLTYASIWVKRDWTIESHQEPDRIHTGNLATAAFYQWFDQLKIACPDSKIVLMIWLWFKSLISQVWLLVQECCYFWLSVYSIEQDTAVFGLTVSFWMSSTKLVAGQTRWFALDDLCEAVLRLSS